jgi:hypothetical protein
MHTKVIFDPTFFFVDKLRKSKYQSRGRHLNYVGTSTLPFPISYIKLKIKKKINNYNGGLGLTPKKKKDIQLKVSVMGEPKFVPQEIITY